VSIKAESYFATIRVGETGFAGYSDFPLTTSYLPAQIIHESFAIVVYIVGSRNFFEVFSSRLILLLLLLIWDTGQTTDIPFSSNVYLLQKPIPY
jgi:hypothetical protein